MFQIKLLALFDDFKIKNIESYHRLPPGTKPYFIRRLFRLFMSTKEDIYKDLNNSGGVKLHFGASGYLDDPNPNIPSETFLKKMAFYSNRTLITFPFRQITNKQDLRALEKKSQKAWRTREAKTMLFGEIATDRDIYGGYVYATGKVYTVDPIAFDDLLKIACNLRPAINIGAAYLLPSFPDSRKQFENKRLGLTSANFQLKDLQIQFNESLEGDNYEARNKSGLTQLLLPHFSNVPFERIIEIRLKEENLYTEFQRRMENLLFGSSQLESENLLLSYMREVDEGVRELRRRFYEIQQNYNRRSIYILIKFVSAALVLMAPSEAREAISAILGSTSLFDYFTIKEEKAKELYETRSNKFYLPWLVFKSKKQNI